MSKCAYCGSSIFIGGVKDGAFVFCNKRCKQEAYLDAASQTVPAEIIAQHVQTWHAGPCPLCKGPGPVDAYTSYRVYSAIHITRWQNFTHVCCRKCARKKQLGNAAFSLFLGWWGIPSGLVMTPVQISRNIRGMMNSPPPDKPSPGLEKAVRRSLGAQVLAKINTPSAVNPTT
jgi:hypothetical protein